MNPRLLRLLALSSALAFPAALEGASSRIELAGGWPREAPRTATTEIMATPVRPLAPGEILLLGPIAAPLSAPAVAWEPPLPASRAAAVSSPAAVDTVVVTAPSAPASPPIEASRPSAAGTSWDTYRTGNVVRIALPRN